jgi:hypothetical protein
LSLEARRCHELVLISFSCCHRQAFLDLRPAQVGRKQSKSAKRAHHSAAQAAAAGPTQRKRLLDGLQKCETLLTTTQMGSEDHLNFLALHALEKQNYEEAVENIDIPSDNPDDDLSLPPQQAAAAVRKRTAAVLNESLKKPSSGREVDRKLKTLGPYEEEISLLHPVVWQTVTLLGKDDQIDVATREFCQMRQKKNVRLDFPTYFSRYTC